MPTLDARIDTYIAKSADFARPILEHLRDLIHQTCPDVVETIKWGMPSFDYNKQPMISMASFKQHCAFSLWKGGLLPDPHGLMTASTESMGNLGRITSLQDLPPDHAITDLIRAHMELNDQHIKVPRPNKSGAPKPLVVSDDFKAALEAIPEAKTVFEGFPPSSKKDYIDWIEDAKTQATRQKRIDQAVEWISEGKTRHWKYKR